MIKVCQILDNLDVGGLEIALLNLVPHLEGYECHIWCLKYKGAMAERAEASGIKVREFNFSGGINIFSILKFAKAMRKEGFGIVHSHGLYPLMWAGPAAILAGVKVIIFHCHSMYYGIPKRDALKVRLLSRFAAKIIAVAEAVKRSLVDFVGVDPDKVEVVYVGSGDMGIQNNLRRGEVRKSLGLNDDDFVIANIGRLVELKGHRFLIEALATCAKRHYNCKCLIVGRGTEEAKIREKIRELELQGSVLMLKHIDDIRGILSASDLLVSSSTFKEGLGVVLIEAASAGLPLIATDVGGQREIVEDGVSGFIVPSKDPAALVEKIEYFIKNPEARRAMGESSRAIWSKKFTIGEMAAKVKNIYISAALKSPVKK